MSRKPSFRNPQHRIPAQRYREFTRAQHIAEVRFRHPYFFKQPQ